MTDDMQKLTEALLDLAKRLAGLYQDGRSLHAIEPEDAVGCAKAADALTRLAAERDALAADREPLAPWLPVIARAEAMRTKDVPLDDETLKAMALTAAKQAEADVARLREALEAIHDMCASAQPTTADRYLDRIDERAATALGETPAREAAE